LIALLVNNYKSLKTYCFKFKYGNKCENGGHMGFRKELGFWHVLFLTLGAIVGDAVAFIPVYVLGYDGPAGILSWIVALLLILPVALVVIELGKKQWTCCRFYKWLVCLFRICTCYSKLNNSFC
jgi:hypothetical protein